MKYPEAVKAIFVDRPNRFIARVELDGRIEPVHIKNTGRLGELLIPGRTVYLCPGANPARRTAYDLISLCRDGDGGPIVNVDSMMANEAAAEWLPKSGLFSGSAVIRREVTWGGSRFDFAITDGEAQTFLEVKGVTLVEDSIAYFPDAPTERGIKHINELIACRRAGYGAMLLFVIKRSDAVRFCPNDRTQPAFGEALRAARAAGVQLMAMDCTVTPDSVRIRQALPIELQ